MSRRSRLRSQLQDAWRGVIEEPEGPYAKGLINSERGLQVHFCIHLQQILQSSRGIREFLVEPAVSVKGQPLRFPDLVVCHSKKIIAVIEFKYLPRSRPSAVKDLDTLQIMGCAGSEVEISNDRYRGKPIKIRRYSIAKDAVFCWAGVYTGSCLQLPPEPVRKLGAKFMRLDARTREGQSAQIDPPCRGEGAA